MNKNNNNNEIFIRIFVSILILLTTHAAIAYILKSIAYTKEIVETVEAKWKKRKRKNDTTANKTNSIFFDDSGELFKNTEINNKYV